MGWNESKMGGFLWLTSLLNLYRTYAISGRFFPNPVACSNA